MVVHVVRRHLGPQTGGLPGQVQGLGGGALFPREGGRRGAQGALEGVGHEGQWEGVAEGGGGEAGGG